MDDFDSRITRLFKENIPINNQLSNNGNDRPISVSGSNNSVIIGNDVSLHIPTSKGTTSNDSHSHAATFDKDNVIASFGETRKLNALSRRILELAKINGLNVPRTNKDLFGHLERKFGCIDSMSLKKFEDIVWYLEKFKTYLLDGRTNACPLGWRYQRFDYVISQITDGKKVRHIRKILRYMKFECNTDFNSIKNLPDLELDFLYERIWALKWSS